MKKALSTFAALLLLHMAIFAQLLDYPQRTFLKENAYPVFADSTLSSASWEYLATHLDDKRFILLGEPTHGAKEILQVRNNLIRFLHEKYGYNTILFGSGIADIAVADLMRKKPGNSSMLNAFSADWHNAENQQLIDYVKASNISIAGYDVLPAGNSFRQLLKLSCSRQELDTAQCDDLEDRLQQIIQQLTNTKTIPADLSASLEILVADYQRLQAQLSVNKPGNFAKELLLTKRIITNRVKYLQYFLSAKNSQPFNSSAARDSMMADNIRFMADSIYKNEKIVVVGDGFHLSNQGETFPMAGQLLQSSVPGKVYTIGIFPGMGSYADSARSVNDIPGPGPNGLYLQQIISFVKGYVTYLHIPVDKSEGTAWLHKNVEVPDLYNQISHFRTIMPARRFNGLLLLKKVTSATPLPAKQ